MKLHLPNAVSLQGQSFRPLNQPWVFTVKSNIILIARFYNQNIRLVQYLNDMTSHKLQQKQTQMFSSHQSVPYNISKV